MKQNSIAIQVNNLGKCYHIYDNLHDRLKQLILTKKKYYREFWAIHNISFKIPKGASIGIIGRNGSGKSTLLQILCKTLSPSTGDVKTCGRIAALLELGAGFNPDFTGRENVYLNGAILGIKKNEMEARIAEIEEFADIGSFIDQPVKTYSSGMFVRLAFSVQACIDPDILIVDEALSVGDIFFQQKCAQRMRRLREKGTTLIFVSHDMSAIRDLCETALYLKSGNLVYNGPSKEAIKRYLAEINHKETTLIDKKITSSINATPLTTSKTVDKINDFACWTSDNINQNNIPAQLISVTVIDNNGLPTLSVQMTQRLKFQVLYRSFTEKPFHITISLQNRYGHVIHCSGSYTHRIDLPKLEFGEYSIFELEIECLIEAGLYTFSVALGFIGDNPNHGVNIDTTPWLGPIQIIWDYENEKAPWLGMFGLPTKAKIILLHEKK